jgi:hypothetical protein
MFEGGFDTPSFAAFDADDELALAARCAMVGIEMADSRPNHELRLDTRQQQSPHLSTMRPMDELSGGTDFGRGGLASALPPFANPFSAAPHTSNMYPSVFTALGYKIRRRAKKTARKSSSCRTLMQIRAEAKRQLQGVPVDVKVLPFYPTVFSFLDFKLQDPEDETFGAPDGELCPQNMRSQMHIGVCTHLPSESRTSGRFAAAFSAVCSKIPVGKKPSGKSSSVKVKAEKPAANPNKEKPKRVRKRGKKVRDPLAPQIAKSPYVFFTKEQWPIVKKANPELQFVDVGRLVNRWVEPRSKCSSSARAYIPSQSICTPLMLLSTCLPLHLPPRGWTGLTHEAKASYYEMAAVDRKRYDEEMTRYTPSEEYLRKIGKEQEAADNTGTKRVSPETFLEQGGGGAAGVKGGATKKRDRSKKKEEVGQGGAGAGPGAKQAKSARAKKSNAVPLPTSYTPAECAGHIHRICVVSAERYGTSRAQRLVIMKYAPAIMCTTIMCTTPATPGTPQEKSEEEKAGENVQEGSGLQEGQVEVKGVAVEERAAKEASPEEKAAAEQAKKEAEESAKKEAEEKAKQEAKEKAKQEAKEEKARARARAKEEVPAHYFVYNITQNVSMDWDCKDLAMWITEDLASETEVRRARMACGYDMALPDSSSSSSSRPGESNKLNTAKRPQLTGANGAHALSDPGADGQLKKPRLEDGGTDSAGGTSDLFVSRTSSNPKGGGSALHHCGVMGSNTNTGNIVNGFDYSGMVAVADTSAPKAGEKSKRKRHDGSEEYDGPRGKKEKGAGQPVGPKNAYSLFTKAVWPQYRETHTKLAIGDVMRKIAEAWSAHPVENKREYMELAAADKRRYNEEMRLYQQQQAMSNETGTSSGGITGSTFGASADDDAVVGPSSRRRERRSSTGYTQAFEFNVNTILTRNILRVLPENTPSDEICAHCYALGQVETE